MIKATLGQVLINSVLPPDLVDYSRKLDKKGTNKLLQDLAEKHPEKYREILHSLMGIAHRSATESGSYSFGVDSMIIPEKLKHMRQDLINQVEKIIVNKHLDDKTKQAKIVSTVQGKTQELEKALYEETVNNKNPMAMQVLSGARGNPGNLRSMLLGDFLYEDQFNKVIPVPVFKSYSEGLAPAEYWASSYGVRKGVADVKFATADSGYFGKQLNQVTHRLVIADRDHDQPDAHFRGMPIDTDDPDSEGAFLSQPVAGYKRNTLITSRVLSDLKDKGHDKILIRSPIVGGHPDGGLYAYDVGVRERGGLPARGELVAMGAAQALGEQTSQGQLCLGKGTGVRMADWSVKNIEDIKVGDEVIGVDKEGKAFPVKVKNWYDNGEKECVRTVFSVGSGRKDVDTVELVSTCEHKIFACGDNEEPELLPVNTKCRTDVSYKPVMTNSAEWSRGESEPFALLLGLLLGDGCYTPSVNNIHLSCYDPILIEHTADYFTALKLKAVLCAGQRGYYRISQIKDDTEKKRDPKTGRMLPGDRNPIRIKLKDYDMYGKYAHDKVIPDSVWTWNQESVRQLLGGLFVTDGSVFVTQQCKDRGSNNVYLNFGSTSKKMAEQVKDLLALRFGIHGSKLNKTNSGRKRTLYSFDILRHHEVLKFAACIPLYGVKRQRIIDMLADVKLTKKEKKYSFFFRKAQESTGQINTYDIEVDHPDHMFLLASGMCVANSSKHQGGVAGASAATTGFKYINTLVQIPKVFPGGATHAETDGKVGAIFDAPAGGKFLMLGGQKHFISAGFAPKVKTGDYVEAGDVLSEGLPNPAKIVEHKGIGEGRRYFTHIFKQMFKDSGLKAHRRNVELLARGLINHVELEEEMGDYLPGDIVPYDMLESHWKPREGHKVLEPKSAVGKYLEKPVLHYTIGTKIQKGMLDNLKHFGVKHVLVHNDPPPFKPQMVQARYNLTHDQDWMTRQLGSELKKGLLDSAHTGATSDELGTSFVPGLARASDFGRVGKTKSWQPSQIIKTEIMKPEEDEFAE